MARDEQTVPAPALTRILQRILPRPLQWVACGPVHTIPAGYGTGCAVCGRDWTTGRRWLRVHGTRSPISRRRPSETTVHVQVAPGLALHRVEGFRGDPYWACAWTWRGEEHSARLRPQVTFAHRNITRQIARDRAQRDLDTFDETGN